METITSNGLLYKAEEIASNVDNAPLTKWFCTEITTPCDQIHIIPFHNVKISPLPNDQIFKYN